MQVFKVYLHRAATLYLQCVYVSDLCVKCVTACSQQQENLLSDVVVSVVGQRVSYINGAAAEEKPREPSSPPHVRPAGREPLRALRPAKGELISKFYVHCVIYINVFA